MACTLGYFSAIRIGVVEFHMRSRIYVTILFAFSCIGSNWREGRSLVRLLSKALNRIRSPVNGWLGRTSLYGTLTTKEKKSKIKKNRKEEEKEEEDGKEDNDNKTTKKERNKDM